jgi:hypothetical protein
MPKKSSYAKMMADAMGKNKPTDKKADKITKVTGGGVPTKLVKI